MKSWLGGVNRAWSFRALKEGSHGLLISSFADVSLSSCLNMIDPSQFAFFLDSGAFSAWSRGTYIDIDEYCAFIRANIEHIEVYACLDVIPGKPGQPASPKQRDEAADQTWANYLYMKREGLDPLPVYHYGEDPRHLQRMLEYGCDYIGIGGLVSVPGKLRQHWLDDLFECITDKEGRPTIKTHGFGMTSIPLIFRYPWYSVDSTTWIKQTMSGCIYLPAMRNGEFVFDELPMTCPVSNRSPKQATDGKHASSMSPAMRKILDRWLEFCGKTFAQVAEHYYHRAVCNVIYFKQVGELKAERPFQKQTMRKRGLL